MVNKFAGEQTIRSVSMVMNLLTTTITFVSIIVLLWAVNPWIVVLIIFTTFPAAWITYKQNNETFFRNLHWSEKGAMVKKLMVYKFSWGYPLKELRSSAPLFISSWIMVAKSFFTLSLSVFAPAFSTYTVLSPNLKVA